MIQEGNDIIFRVINEEYKKLYPEDIVNAVLNYLTSEEVLSYVGSHIGLKDLILTNVSIPLSTFQMENIKLCFKFIIAIIYI